MIDLFTLVAPPLEDDAISHIVWRNGLQTNSKDGVVFYDNMGVKNLKKQNGIYIRIETNRKLKVEGSLHKYFNEISGYDRNNYNLFSMSQAKRAIDRLMFDKGINVGNARIYNYEIGLNLNMEKNCRAYLDKMKTIGAVGNERTIYVNPRYKDERSKTTVFHNHTRKYFKAYDKGFESVDKKRKIIPDGNILRIETVYRRLDNCLVVDFFAPDNLKKMVEAFFRDWRTIQFEQDIITPKGTGRAKRQLCIDIMETGTAAVLTRAKERQKSGALSDWEYRNIREFIANEWRDVKQSISFIQSDEEQEFRQLLKTNHTILTHDDFIR